MQVALETSRERVNLSTYSRLPSLGSKTGNLGSEKDSQWSKHSLRLVSRRHA